MIKDNEIYLWLARENNKDGLLFLFDEEPVYDEYKVKDLIFANWRTDIDDDNAIYIGDKDVLSEVTFENSPVQVKLTIVNDDESDGSAYLWLARDLIDFKYFNGSLHLYSAKPIYDECDMWSGSWHCLTGYDELFICDKDVLPEISFEKSPVKVKLTII